MIPLLFIFILLGALDGCGPPPASIKVKSEFGKKLDAQEKLARTTTKYEILNVKVDQGSLQFDFKMDNESTVELKDFMIYCYPVDQSKPQLNRRHHIIHKTVPAKSSKTFSGITLDFDKNVQTAQCELVYFFFGDYRVWLKEEK